MIPFVNTIVREIVNRNENCDEISNCVTVMTALAFLTKTFAIPMVHVSVNRASKENFVPNVRMISILTDQVAIVNIVNVLFGEVCLEIVLLVVFALVNRVGVDQNAKQKPNHLKIVIHVPRRIEQVEKFVALIEDFIVRFVL